MSSAIQAPFPIPRGLALALAALGPIAAGGLLAARTHDVGPMLAAPAIVFGVVAATGPALYIATAAVGQAPPLAAVVRAFQTALGAFGLALAGLILPAAFLALSSVTITTTIAAATIAVHAAGLIGVIRLARELAIGATQRTLLAAAVFAVWAVSVAAIAGRLWWELAVEVAS